MSPLRALDPDPIRRALEGLTPYEPGKPVEEVQRELGLERIVKLASNEGPYGPFPAAREALARAEDTFNRYPDGGAYRLRSALAERHDVRLEEVAVASGADAVIGYVCQATLDPGDEVVTGWPSFVSYVLDPLKQAAVPVRVPLREHRYDLEALLGAVTPRTKLVFVATPNNPTGTMTTRDELRAYFDGVPEHVLTIVDQAYFEYLDEPEYPDVIEEFAKEGHRVLVLRTFSKIYGLAGLRVGYGVGPEPVVNAIKKVQRAFEVDDRGAGGGAREPRRRARARPAQGLEPSGDEGPRVRPSRPGVLRRRAGRRKLRLRGRRGRCGCAERRVAAARCDRAAHGRIRCADGAACHRRHAGGDRVLLRAAVGAAHHGLAHPGR